MSVKKGFFKILSVFASMSLFSIVLLNNVFFVNAATIDITTGFLYVYSGSEYSLSDTGPQGNILDATTVVTSNGDLTIVLADGADATIQSLYVDGNLVVLAPEGAVGTGKLTANSSATATEFAIVCTGNVTVNNGNLKGISTKDSGIHMKKNVTITNGCLEGIGDFRGVIIDGSAVVSGGTLAGAAVGASGTFGLVIYGDVEISGGNVSGESGCFGFGVVGNLTISGGKVTGTAIGDNSEEDSGNPGGDTGNPGGGIGIGFLAPAYGIWAEGNITITGGEVRGYAENGDEDTVGVWVEPGFSIYVSGGLLVGEAQKGDQVSARHETYGIAVWDGGITVKSVSPDGGKLVAKTDDTGISGQPFLCNNGAPSGAAIFDQKYTNDPSASYSADVTPSIPNSIWPSDQVLINTTVLYRLLDTQDRFSITIIYYNDNISTAPIGTETITQVSNGSIIQNAITSSALGVNWLNAYRDTYSNAGMLDATTPLLSTDVINGADVTLKVIYPQDTVVLGTYTVTVIYYNNSINTTQIGEKVIRDVEEGSQVLATIADAFGGEWMNLFRDESRYNAGKIYDITPDSYAVSHHIVVRVVYLPGPARTGNTIMLWPLIMLALSAMLAAGAFFIKRRYVSQ